MTEKDEPGIIEESNLSEPFSVNSQEEDLEKIQDSDEEIIELTDPDDSPIAESEEEIIEPADFLDDLSEEDNTFNIPDNSDGPSLDGGNDIIELTDTVEETPAVTSSPQNTAALDSDLLSDDKDLFVFTDTADGAIIDDDDILSGTVFADVPAKTADQNMTAAPNNLIHEKNDPADEDISMFNDTVFANDLSGDADEELAVLTEIENNPQKIEDNVFGDTVFSDKSIKSDDDEFAVLTEAENNIQGVEENAGSHPAFIEEPSGDSDMVLFEDTESFTDKEEEAVFVQPNISTIPDTNMLSSDGRADTDIADSLGIELESNADLSTETAANQEVKLTIEPDSESFDEMAEQIAHDKPQRPESSIHLMDQQAQSVSAGSISIDPAQLEAAVEKVIKKMVGPKFDSLIIDVIEKAVQSDIDKIKKELLKGVMDDS